MQNIGIVGAGIIGRLLALRLSEENFKVSLYEQNSWTNTNACSTSAAGMIAPYCELDTAEYLIARMGMESLEYWPQIISRLSIPVYFNEKGSLVIAHQNDHNELIHLKHRIARHPLRSQMQDLDMSGIQELEPELGTNFSKGLYYPLEAAIDNRELLAALLDQLQKNNVRCLEYSPVAQIHQHSISSKWGTETYDWVIDCRGINAQKDLKDLRGVRGELVILNAPDVNIHRPIRLLHPRYPIYIVPRPHHQYFIGATAIETEDRSEISVRTCLELLSAAYSVHQGFAEARLIETVTNLRPAFDDNIPQVRFQDGLMVINGLYRHGFLLAPTLINEVVGFLQNQSLSERYQDLFMKI